MIRKKVPLQQESISTKLLTRCLFPSSLGSFFLACEIFWRLFDHSFPACAFCVCVEISSRTLIPLFTPGSVHNGSASWDDCARMFPDELCVSSFMTGSLDSGIVNPLQLRWVKEVCAFRVICHLTFWQNDRGLLHTTAVTRGGTDTEWVSNNNKMNTGEENSPATLAGIRTRNLSITSPVLR